MRRYGNVRGIVIVCMAAICAAIAAQPSQPGTNAQSARTTTLQLQPAPYVFALTALKDEGLQADETPFLTKLPKLLLAALETPPPRYEEQAYRDEIAQRAALVARFEKGNDLYMKLDAAAKIELDPTLADWVRSDNARSAARAISKADAALTEYGTRRDPTRADATLPPALLPQRSVQAWDGKGLLFDLGSDSPLRAGRKQSVDLVVTGTATSVGSYVEVKLEGWDSALGRKVFAWDDFSTPDDPNPLATELAARLFKVLASSPVARFDLSVKPASARMVVDGKALDSSELVLFSPGNRVVSISTWAPGRKEENRDILLLSGESQELTIDLEPQIYGSAKVDIEPQNAGLLVGGIHVDANRPIGLVGLQDIAIASAPGYEKKMFVLPAQGTPYLDLKLRLSDGLGPGKRTDTAKDDFYMALGLVAIGIPVASLAQGYQSMYLEANYRQGFGFVKEWTAATTFYGIAVVATSAAAIWVATRLVALLGGMSQE